MTQGFNSRVLAALVLLLVAGCSAPQRQKPPAIFFPPPPELPRIQYLTSFTGLKDIEKQSAFNRFIVGEKRNVQVDKPYGVAVYDGKIYVCDTNNAAVAVFDLKRQAFEALKGAIGPGKLVQPINISIDAEGNKYVADPVRGQVLAFDRNDEFVKAYAAVGAWRPVDAVAFEQRLYVADVANGLVKVFDRQSGEMIKAFGDKGAPSERLDRPTNLAMDAEGDLYVTDVARFQVVKFDRDGHFKLAIGQPGDNIGHFARPKGIAVDRQGHVYVVDASFNNVQIFNEDGRVVGFFGHGGENPGDFLLPAQVAIDYDNLEYFRQYVDPNFQAEYLIVVTSQFGPRRVNVLAFGREKGKTYPTEAELLKLIDERRKNEQDKARP
jgi:sugar lactone lactonase YvrE